MVIVRFRFSQAVMLIAGVQELTIDLLIKGGILKLKLCCTFQ